MFVHRLRSYPEYGFTLLLVNQIKSLLVFSWLIFIHKTPFWDKNHIANHRNPKKTTTFAFNKRYVTYLRKCPITQHLVSDSGHSTKRLKRGGTTRICKAVKYNDLHLSPHFVYLSKQRLYRLKWIVTDNQWCKYAASESDGLEIAISNHNHLE